MPDELKPCPFCGGEVEMQIYPQQVGEGDIRENYFIRCNNGDHDANVCDFLENPDDAITAWNTRPEPVQSSDALDQWCNKWQIRGAMKDDLEETLTQDEVSDEVKGLHRMRRDMQSQIESLQAQIAQETAKTCACKNNVHKESVDVEFKPHITDYDKSNERESFTIVDDKGNFGVYGCARSVEMVRHFKRCYQHITDIMVSVGCTTCEELQDHLQSQNMLSDGKRIEELEDALRGMAKQKLTCEMSNSELAEGDFFGAYDFFIKTAKQALGVS